MPNWCSCDLFIKAKKKHEEEIIKFKEHARTETKDGVNVLDTNKFIPIPKSLQEVSSGSSEHYYYAWYGNNKKEWDKYGHYKKEGINTQKELQEKLLKENPQAKEIADKYKFNMDNYGVLSWYDWALKNWGTKWGICHAEYMEQDDLKVLFGELNYIFDTAWSPPFPIITKMSKMFPNLKFDLRYYEGGNGYKGRLVCKGGEVVKSTNSNYRGGRGG